MILGCIPNNTIKQKWRRMILSWWNVISAERVTVPGCDYSLWHCILHIVWFAEYLTSLLCVKSSGMLKIGSQTLACIFFSLHLRNLLYTKKAFCYFFSKPNFLSLTCYKMSHVKKPSMCEVYPFSVKTLQTKQLACSLFKMLLLKAELSRETSYVWSIIQCMWDNNTL